MRSAFCLSGLSRCIPITYHWIQKYFIEPYNCDVFFRSWTTTEHLNDHSPFKAIELYDPKGSELEDYEEGHFIRLMETACKGDQARLEKARSANRHRAFAMWWNVAKCFDLAIDSRIPYDFVFRGRPDGYYAMTFDFNKAKPRTLYILGSKFNDGFAAGDVWTMREYSRLFHRIDNYLAGYNAYSTEHWLCPHLLQEFHLKSMEVQGFQVVRLKGEDGVLRAGKIWDDAPMTQDDDPFERAKYYEDREPL